MAKVEQQAENGETSILDVTEIQNCGNLFILEESIYDTLLEGSRDMHEELHLLIYVVHSDWDEIDRCGREFIGSN